MQKIPKIGMRTIKTAISVLVCMLVFQLLTYLGKFIPDADTVFNNFLRFITDRKDPLFACIAAIVSMQSSVESSLLSGFNRIIGTFIGGAFGLLLLLLDDKFYNRSFNLLFIFIGILLVIYFCNLINKSEAIATSLVPFLIIMISTSVETPYRYAINRLIDTTLGIIISVTINLLILKPKIIIDKEETE